MSNEIKRININDFYAEVTLNDEIMVSLESAPPKAPKSLESYPKNLILSFICPDNGWGKTPYQDFYLTKEEVYKLADFLSEFKQTLEIENESLEEKNE